MFPTNPALEAAVIADCENDLPRLVYADWLDEHGDPARAAFIRVQIALHDKSPADPDYPDLLEARREAFDAMQGRFDLHPKLPRGLLFTDDFFDPDRDTLLDPPRGFVRGFPHVARLRDGSLTAEKRVEKVVAALPELLARTTIRGLFSGDNPPRQLNSLIETPEGGRLTALSLDTRLTAREPVAEAYSIAEGPIADSLRWLAYSPNHEAYAFVLSFADFPHLQRWEARRGFECSAAAARALFAAGWFGRLHHLLSSLDADQAKAFWSACAANKALHTLEISGAEPGAFLPLAKTKAFHGLGRLDIDFDTEYRADDDIAALVRAKLPKLRAFKFTGGALRHDTHKELFAADWFAGLRVLELGSGYLDDRTVLALGKSAAAGKLRSLTLTTRVMSRKSLLSLAQSYPELTTLDLSKLAGFVTPDPADMTAFLTALALPKLRHLSLGEQLVNDAVAVALAKNPSVKNLTRLDLTHAPIGAKGLRAIVNSPHLQRLVHLDLSWAPVQDAVEVLADPAVLPNLVWCWLPEEVSKRVMRKLRNARGDIFHDWHR